MKAARRAAIRVRVKMVVIFVFIFYLLVSSYAPSIGCVYEEPVKEMWG
jgi:hypothetical protein